MPEQLQVSELFYSIQGESTRAGLPCAFIRLSGCNLHCSYCDSSYTQDEPGKKMSIDQIITWLRDFPKTMVEITGGEPLLQDSVYPLMEKLLKADRSILLETSGSLSIQHVPTAVSIILDLKCPGSGMAEKNFWSNLDLLRYRKKLGSRDEIKFVLSSEEDFSWAQKIICKYQLTKDMPVLFSPVIPALPPERVAARILREQLPVRLQLQLHKQIWPGIHRGV